MSIKPLSNLAKRRLQTLTNNQINDGVLRELIIKDLSMETISEINNCIERRRNQIKILKMLKGQLIEDMEV